MNALERKMRKLLESYIGEAEQKKDSVRQEDVDMFIGSACRDHIEQEVINYAAEHPEASFWDFLELLEDGVDDGPDDEEDDD